MFWSQNTFYLPRGPLAHTEYYFDRVLAPHIALIRNIRIQFSLLDLTEEVVAIIENIYPESISHETISYFLVEALEHIWIGKLRWIQQWTGLQSVRLELMDDLPPVVFLGEGFDPTLPATFTILDGWPVFDGCRVIDMWYSTSNILSRSVMQAEGKIDAVLSEIGWVKFKAWLRGDNFWETARKG